MTTKIQIPVLETKRLRLRSHRESDFEACARMWANPIVVRYTIGTPSNPPGTWMRMLTFQGLWQMFGYGYWAIEEKESGAYVGDLGFADFKRDIQPSIDGIPELGWALAPEFHGRGYATEAATEALVWAEVNVRPPKTVCIVSPENVASLRVADKIGYASRRAAVFKGEPTFLFEKLNGRMPPQFEGEG